MCEEEEISFWKSCFEERSARSVRNLVGDQGSLAVCFEARNAREKDQAFPYSWKLSLSTATYAAVFFLGGKRHPCINVAIN